MSKKKRGKRRRGTLLPQTKALRHLAENGILADPVERKMGLISKDFLGFADIIAVDPLTGVVWFIQVTSRSNFASRRKKILESDVARKVARANPKAIYIAVWGYDSKSDELKPQRSEFVRPDDFD